MFGRICLNNADWDWIRVGFGVKRVFLIAFRAFRKALNGGKKDPNVEADVLQMYGVLYRQY